MFEGADGVGKSTQIRLCAERLRDLGIPVCVTREPGGAPAAEKLRELLVRGNPDEWSPIAEALMMYAARAEHLRATITPARARGEVVLCDRFSDSTRAYQAAAGGVDPDLIEALDRAVVASEGPDLTLVLDLDETTAAARLRAREATTGDPETRFERKGAPFQARVRSALRAIARRAPTTHVLIDASVDAETIAGRVAAAMAPLIDAWQRSHG